MLELPEKSDEKEAPKYTWSYSSLDLFKQCPHKYYRLRVKKDIVEPQNEHMLYGLEVHKAAEDFVRDNKPIPPQFSQFEETLQVLKTREGRHLCEHRMGLKRDLTPCEFFDKEVWWRGIADLITLQEDRAFVLDYKTGKSSKYADTKQLEILSLAVFKHFPQVKKVKAGLLFLIAQDLVKAEFDAANESHYWMHWIEDTGRLEKAIELNVWNPRPNFTCKGYCAVRDCTHNGRK